jgi:hypothetical protein
MRSPKPSWSIKEPWFLGRRDHNEMRDKPRSPAFDSHRAKAYPDSFFYERDVALWGGALLGATVKKGCWPKCTLPPAEGPYGWVDTSGSGTRDRIPLRSSAAIDAQPLYAAPSHSVCTISGYRQYSERGCTPRRRTAGLCSGLLVVGAGGPPPRRRLFEA